MSNGLYEFVWQVAAQGHHWLDDYDLGEGADGKVRRVYIRLLAPASGQEHRVRVYAPLRKHPALFRTFAKVPATEAAVKTFADQYGLLGNKSAEHHAGESFTQWTADIAAMRRAVFLWDRIRIGDTVALAKVIKWRDEEGGPAVVYEEADASSVIASSDFHPEILARIPKGDCVLPARVLLHRWVNTGLKGRATPQLLLDAENTWSSVLKIVPHSLLGCLWLQLAQEISGGKKPVECASCKDWFYVKIEGTRADKQYCSAACRNRVYRQRQERAHQLRAEGKAPKAIATELETDIPTVKNWLKRKKG